MNTREVDEEIAKSKNRLADIKLELEMEEAILRNLRLKKIKDEYGVEIGSVVLSRGKTYRVTGINTRRMDGKPWIDGTPMNKNGEWSKAVRVIYGDWELKGE